MSDTTQEETQTQAPPGLNVQDLLLIVKLIHIGTERGAWRTDELTTVGGVFERLVSFLESVGAITRTPVTETAPVTTDTGVTTETVTSSPEGKENTNAETRSET